MSKKLEKILDQKTEKVIDGIDQLISDIKVINKDEGHKIMLLRKQSDQVMTDLNSMYATWNKYLGSIERINNEGNSK